MVHSYPSIPDFRNLNFLITGGAGFIGSHLCDFLIASGAQKIRVLDNFSTGNKKNIEHHLIHPKFEIIEGNISDPDVCFKCCDGINVVVHLAALGSVPRSIENPLATHAANSTGFLNMLWAAKNNNIEKFVFASSSSVYGDNLISPKKEGNEGSPLSPYACTKQNNEAYAKTFHDLYGLKTIGLRFFNIFGARQNKDGPYAAFIPLVLSSVNDASEINIYGDGKQSRDFTYVANAIWAIACSIVTNEDAAGKAFNIGCGESTSLLNVINITENISSKKIKVKHHPTRMGDIKDSLADLTYSKLLLQYQPIYKIEDGLRITYQCLIK